MLPGAKLGASWKVESSVSHSCVQPGEAWAPWSEWSECDCKNETPYKTVKSRSRQCIDLKILGCDGDFNEVIDCDGTCDDGVGVELTVRE